MELRDIAYQGPEIGDQTLLDQLPTEYKNLLQQVNGFVQFGNGLHIRGICCDPDWHSLATVWNGNLALYKLYPILTAKDIPFGQNVFGDQYILRNGFVYKLLGETGELEAMDCGLLDFLGLAQNNPVEYLELHPLVQFYNNGGVLEPGQLLSVYPPFCTQEAANGVSLKPISVPERIKFLTDFAAQIATVADGEALNIKVTEND